MIQQELNHRISQLLIENIWENNDQFKADMIMGANRILQDSDSIHFRRTMMSAELKLLLTSIPMDVNPDFYKSAIIENNILAKRTTANRAYTANYLESHYSFNLKNPVFRVLRVLSDYNSDSLPLLACMYSIARDHIFRASSILILNSTEGESLNKTHFQKQIENEFRDRFTTKMAESLSRNLAASWTQSGHLKGRVNKRRQRVKPTSVSVVYALALGLLNGSRGLNLFNTVWMQLLDSDRNALEEYAFQASRDGIFDFRKSGDVIDIRFDDLLARHKPENSDE